MMKISKTSEKILSIFFMHPNQKLYINEIIRKTSLYPNAVQRSLKTLEDQHILSKARNNHLVYYYINESYSYLSELKTVIRPKANKSEGNKSWVKILNREFSYPFAEALYKSNTRNLKERYGVSINTFWQNHETLGVYYYREELIELGKTLSQSIEKDLGFAKQDIKNCRKVCNELITEARRISELNLKNLSDKVLSNNLESFYMKFQNIFPFVTVPHAIERYFESKIREFVTNNSDYDLLSSPISFLDDEQESALRVASLKISSNKKKYKEALMKHYNEFCWLSSWSIDSKPLEYRYFENEINNILRKFEEPDKEVKRIQSEEKNRAKAVEKVLKNINASKSLIEHVRLMQEYIALRTFRKNAICKANFYHLQLLSEIGKRLNLSSERVKVLSYQEMIDGLRGLVAKKNLREQIRQREKGWAILVNNGKFIEVNGGKEIMETIERHSIISANTNIKMIVKGKTACPGNVTGPVKIITKLEDISKVEKGDVLVAKMTTPDYMIAIHNAVAIVTDEGGITCHAAIVSRECNIPCVIGTKNATQVLSDGDLVEVDANVGIVTIIEGNKLPDDIRVIPGKTIYKGNVKGIARIVQDVTDYGKVKEGDILVTSQTTPEYLSLLYRVKGFVVDEDSSTSHAVLYGNVLKLPSIMGTKFARNVINDGDEIELDATSGLLKRTKNE